MTFDHQRQVDALVRIYEAAERDLTRQVTRALASGELGTAAYRRSQLQQIQVLLAQLQQEALPRAVAILQASYRDGLRVAAVAGVTDAFSGIHTEAVNVLADSLSSRLGQGVVNIGRQVEDVYRREGLRLAALQLAEGSSRVEASKALTESLVKQGTTTFIDRAGRNWGLSNYTEMVMRTTTREAVSEGTKNRLIEGGLDLVIWDANGEACEECQALDGNEYSLTGATEGYDVIENMPPLHPNCFPAGTMVEGPRALASSTRWYEGDLVEIRTASGNFLSVTPNHPVLAPHGFVAAGSLTKGDDVVSQVGGHGSVRLDDPSDYQQPAFIEDVAGSLGGALPVPAVTVPITPEDFHGDGVGSEVSVVRADGLLRDGLDASFGQPDLEQLLGGGDVKAPSLSGHGSLDLGVHPVHSAPRSHMRRSDLSAALGSGHAAGTHLPGLSPTAGFDPVPQQEVAKSGALATLSPGEGLLGLASEVTADQIVSVRRVPFAGHVYNLQTVGEWYSANGVLVHNCECILTPSSVTLDELEAALASA